MAASTKAVAPIKRRRARLFSGSAGSSGSCASLDSDLRVRRALTGGLFSSSFACLFLSRKENKPILMS